MTPKAAFTVAVFASGGGSNLQILIDRIRTGALPVRIAFVLSNNSRCKALERAASAGVTALHVSAKTEGSEAAAADKMAGLMREHAVDLLVLAGYMKKISPTLLAAMPNRIVNIHPALLPSFGGDGYYGHRVHEAVLARGCQITGMTVHMVNEEYDAGQILFQDSVRVMPEWDADDVASAVLALEHAHYWRVIRGFAEGRLKPSPSGIPGRAVSVSPDFLKSMA